MTGRRSRAGAALWVAGAMTGCLLISAGPATADASAHARRPVVDLQAHRGGLGLTVENTIAGFSTALSLGVSTLELDVQITRDGYPVVTHDRDPSERKCRDTRPAFEGDRLFPYVPGQTYIKDLTLAQVRTIDCGSLTLPEHPHQKAAPGSRMPLLSEVFRLVRIRRASHVKLNIETKVEAGAPEQTAPREQFVRVVAGQVRRWAMDKQVTIQSFDWGALMRMRQVAPHLPIVALTNGQQFLQIGMPGASPWLGGLDIDDFDADLVAAASSFGADAISPVHGDPQNGTVDTPGYVPYTTSDLVRRAHRARMKVIPWTVDDEATMNKLIDDGVDGIITDYPDRLRHVLKARALPLPRRYPPR
jgi:glycerophosphoryl diester phosphodiesterase